jgi:DNA-binding MarR family transcriptional regulator
MRKVQSIMDSFRRIVRVLRTASRNSEGHIGLRAGPSFVLQQLEKFEPISLNGLAEKTYSHQSTVSVVVNDLVNEGYVRRTQSEKDRRYIVLETTPKAKALLKNRIPTIQEKFAAVIEKMDAKDAQELARLLEIFVEEAGLSSEKPHFFFEQEKEDLPAEKAKTKRKKKKLI